MLIRKFVIAVLVPILTLQVNAGTVTCGTGQKMADSGNSAMNRSMNAIDGYVARTQDSLRDANTQCFNMLKSIPAIVPGTSDLPLPSLVGPIVSRVMGQVINNQFSRFCDQARVRAGDTLGKINNVGNIIQNPTQTINNIVTPMAAQVPSNSILETVRSIFK
ncbi:MAG: hypothetical protein Q7K26_01575 [bacterium]|nr:hypothetical protein [bacterium]